jgi:predicted site-specific integrase-resolvase
MKRQIHEIADLPAGAFLTSAEAADLLSVKPQTLAVWRMTGRVDLPFTKIGPKAVRYRKGDLDRFLADQ